MHTFVSLKASTALLKPQNTHSHTHTHREQQRARAAHATPRLAWAATEAEGGSQLVAPVRGAVLDVGADGVLDAAGDGRALVQHVVLEE